MACENRDQPSKVTQMKYFEDRTIQQLERSARRARLAALASAFCAVLATASLVIVWSNRVRLPESVAGHVPGQKHLVDIVLLDDTKVSRQDIEQMIKPLLLVSAMRMPDRLQHFRIVVSSHGLPSEVPVSEGAAAGYLPDPDYFVVDAQKVTSSSGAKGITAQQEWAFVMAHEATHLWQKQRGTMISGENSHAYDPDGYIKDPIELEAYEEGVSVANAFPGPTFIWKFIDGKRITGVNSVLYVALASYMDVGRMADIRVAHQLTARGCVRRSLALFGLER